MPYIVANKGLYFPPDSILGASTIGQPPSSAEMSQLQIPTKGLRKRLSSEAVGGDKSRQRMADLPAKKEMGMSDMLAEINGIKEERGSR